MDKVLLHNQIAPIALRSLCGPIIDGGGDGIDLMIALESVIAGAFLMAVHLGGDEPVLDALFDRVKERLAEKRLADLDPRGQA